MQDTYCGFSLFRRALAVISSLAIACCAATLPAVAQDYPGTAIVLDGTLVGYPRIEVRGMTQYDPTATWNYAIAHVLHTEGSATAVEIAKAIELTYREDGYFLARVNVVPGTQRGTAILLVEEGTIDTLEVIGVSDAIGQRIASYLKPVVGTGPVKLADFERALMLASDLGGVTVRSEVRFREGGDSGKADLKIHAQSIRSRGSVVIDSPPAANSLTATVLEDVYSTLFAGDLFRAIIGGATDFNQSVGGTLGAYYRVPIGVEGTYSEFYVGNSRFGRNISGVLNNNYQQGFNAIGMVGHPLFRSVDEFYYVLFENEYGDLASWNGMGRDTSEAFRGTLLYSRAGKGGSELKIGATFSAGWAGGDNINTTVDPEFWHMRFGFGLGVPLDWLWAGLGVRNESLAQFTGSALPATEKFWLGDRERNRGYPIAVVTGDTGFASSFGVHKHFHIGEGFVQAIAPYTFFDLGYASSNSTLGQPVVQTPVLASTGVGARLFLDHQIMMSGWLGIPLVNSFNGSFYGPTAYVRLTKSW